MCRILFAKRTGGSIWKAEPANSENLGEIKFNLSDGNKAKRYNPTYGTKSRPHMRPGGARKQSRVYTQHLIVPEVWPACHLYFCNAICPGAVVLKMKNKIAVSACTGEIAPTPSGHVQCCWAGFFKIFGF